MISQAWTLAVDVKNEKGFSKNTMGKKDGSAVKLKSYQKTTQNQKQESCWFLCSLCKFFEFLAQGNLEIFSIWDAYGIWYSVFLKTWSSYTPNKLDIAIFVCLSDFFSMKAQVWR